MRFTTREFINSHGKAPKGRGMWAFIFRTVQGTETWFCPQPGTLVEARKAATQEAKSRGNVFEIGVAP